MQQMSSMLAFFVSSHVLPNVDDYNNYTALVFSVVEVYHP